MAAGRAAEAGAKVLLLEKTARPGRKLCITGKGRCNLTNTAELPDFLDHFGNTGKFLRQAFAQFFNTELIDFLQELGLPVVTERGGRVFPQSGKAFDVRKVLERWAKARGVETRTEAAVEKILLSKENLVQGVQVNGRPERCDALILATGGASYPLTGSTGDGYRLAAAAGHTILPIRPALVPLESKGTRAARMSGLSLRNIKASIYINGKKRAAAFGELLFTDFGLSGPVILTLSGLAVDELRQQHQVVFSLDLKPALDEKKLEARLLRDFSSRAKEPLNTLLRGLLPKEMVPVCLEENQLPATRTGGTVTAPERKRLRCWLKDLRFEISKARPLAEAIITAGGISTREIDPRSMESRLIGGLFFAGEIIDIQADTGGYNLQAAFSTGWLAGFSAAQGSPRAMVR